MTNAMRTLLALIFLMTCSNQSLRADPASDCSAARIAEAVDKAGRELRALSSATQPKLSRELAALRDKKGWSNENFEETGLEYLRDDSTDAWDMKASELLGKIDTLGRTDGAAAPSCSALNDVNASSAELQSVMRAKSDYLSERISKELGGTPSDTQPAAAGGSGKDAATSEAAGPVVATIAVPSVAAQPNPTVTSTPAAAAAASAAPTAASANGVPAAETDGAKRIETLANKGTKVPTLDKPAATPPASAVATEPPVGGGTTPAARPPLAAQPATPKAAPVAPAQKQATVNDWSTSTASERAPREPGFEAGLPYTPGAPTDQNTFVAGGSGEQGYSIDEIREITRGFFGTISTSLASVIEYAFKKSGRPSGYVVGKEGGGAFLAGLRFGEGTLYMRTGATQKVYWHGPSIGYDFGAEGGRTLFLVYNLNSPEGVFRPFTGVDGSAYLVGGVGLTLLKGGDVLMAPIRSGLGLRLGANIGYVKFSANKTWNPF